MLRNVLQFYFYIRRRFCSLTTNPYFCFMTKLTQQQHLDSIEQSFRYYYRPLTLFALHYVKDTDVAQDIVQECFANLWEKQTSETPAANIKSYLYTMVRNKCVDELRQSDHLPIALEPSDLDAYISEEECERRSIIEARLWTAIDKLPERCREIFLLSKRDGLKYQEIATKLDISVNTVENHVRKALKQLRDSAEKIYYFIFG